MAKYFAKLIIGAEYEVKGCIFLRNKEVEVDADLCEYLDGNPQFEVRIEEDAPKSKSRKQAESE